MKIKSGFMLRSIAGRNIVVPVGNRSLDFNGMITLNESATFHWEQLEKGAEEQELVRAVLERYEDVDEDLAMKSVSDFLDKLREVDCLE